MRRRDAHKQLARTSLSKQRCCKIVSTMNVLGFPELFPLQGLEQKRIAVFSFPFCFLEEPKDDNPYLSSTKKKKVKVQYHQLLTCTAVCRGEPGCDKVEGPHNWPSRATPSSTPLSENFQIYRLSQMSSPALSGHVQCTSGMRFSLILYSYCTCNRYAMKFVGTAYGLAMPLSV